MDIPNEGSLLLKCNKFTSPKRFALYLMCSGVMLPLLYIYIALFSCLNNQKQNVVYDIIIIIIIIIMVIFKCYFSGELIALT